MVRTHLRKLALASLALGLGFAHGSALAQSDAGSSDASSPDALGGTSLFQTTVGAPGISGTALAPTDPNAPGAQGGTTRRQVDAEALADLLRGDHALGLTLGRSPQDFAPHFAQPSDQGRRLGPAQFGGTALTQTNPGGAVPAHAGANSASAPFRGDNGLGLGHNPQGFTKESSGNGRRAGQTEVAEIDGLNGRRLGQMRRSVDATIANQVGSARSALVANTIADQAVSAGSALVANVIADSNVDSAATFPGTSPASLSDGSPDVLAAAPDNRRQLGQTQLAASDDLNGSRLGEDVNSKKQKQEKEGKHENALVASAIATSNLIPALTLTGNNPVSLSNGSPEILAAAPSPVPEPASWLLLALGLLALAGRALMRRGALLR